MTGTDRDLVDVLPPAPSTLDAARELLLELGRQDLAEIASCDCVAAGYLSCFECARVPVPRAIALPRRAQEAGRP